MITLQQHQIQGYLAQLTQSGLTPLNRDGYNIFLKIIKCSGEEISGRLLTFNNSSLQIRVPLLTNENNLNKRTYRFSANEIQTMTFLDRTYPPKLALDWLYEKDINDRWLVTIIRKEEEVLTGILLNVIPEYKNGYFHPYFFWIQTDPYKPYHSIQDNVSLTEIQEIRLLYCSKSYDEERENLINDACGATLLRELTTITCQYIYGDIPDQVPPFWYFHFALTP